MIDGLTGGGLSDTTTINLENAKQYLKKKKNRTLKKVDIGKKKKKL